MDRKVTIDFSELNDEDLVIILQWFENIIDQEIDETNGTIANEELWVKGSDTEEQILMRKENIRTNNLYKDFMTKMLNDVRNIKNSL